MKPIVHPGEILNDKLEVRKITKEVFSKSIGIELSALNEILIGKRNISKRLSVKLEENLGITSSFWNNLQNDYNEKSYQLR